MTTRRSARALVYGAAAVAVVASTAFSCTVGTDSDDNSTGTHTSAPPQGGSTGGASSSGGKGHATAPSPSHRKSGPSHTKPSDSATPEWKPSGPARVTTCGTAPDGYPCAIHGDGFKPGEIVDWSVAETNARNSNRADEHGAVDFGYGALAPGLTSTRTIQLHGEDSGLEASGSWTVTCSGSDSGCLR